MLLSTATAALALLAGSSLAEAKPVKGPQRDETAACHALWESAPKKLADLTIEIASYQQAGLMINDTAQGGANSQIAGPFPEMCRFRSRIKTSDKSSVLFEVLLPPENKWNKDWMMTGNGGDAGFVYYQDMLLPIAKYGYAISSTDTGHTGGGGDGSFARNNTESQIDFGYRAVHLTTVYSKEIVKLYYGKKANLAYWSGCSSGGKQGLKEIQAYPEDFDAAIIGSPAYYWSHLNGYTQYVNAIVNTAGTSKWIKPTSWALLFPEVLRQCDMNDGVKDGVITEPGKCFLDFSKFQCDSNGNAASGSALNSTTCLSGEQVQTFKNVHTNWTDPKTGKLVFSAFNYGSEFGLAAGASGTPYGPAPNFFLYQVLNRTDLVLPVVAPNLTIDGKPPTEAQLLDLVYEADKSNPGQTTADNPNLAPFFKRGGKVILYVGGADSLIPTNSTHVYYQSVVNKLGDVSKNMVLFDVPGMGHCRGNGADSFGQPQQGRGGLESAVFDTKHDAFLAIRDWRVNGTKPEYLIAAKYKNGANATDGIAFTRKLCPYPLVGRYTGKGDDTDAKNYECRA